VNRGERAALRHYRLRGYRLLDANARVGRYELDLVLRRGASLLFVEVKEKSGLSFGHPFEMVDEEKARRVRTAARGWLAAHPELARLTVSLEVAGVIHGAVERAPRA
jgi:putative endonuclease